MSFNTLKILFCLPKISTNTDLEPFVAIQPQIYQPEESSDNSESSDSYDDKIKPKSLSLEMTIDLRTQTHAETEEKYDLLATRVSLMKFTKKSVSGGIIYGEQIYTPKDVLIPTKQIRVDNFRLYLSPRAIYEDIGNERKLCQFISIHSHSIRSIATELETLEILQNFKSLMEIKVDLEYAYRFCIKLKGKTPDCNPKDIYTNIFKVVFGDDGLSAKLEEVDPEIYNTGKEQF